MDILGHCDLVTDGATRYCERVFCHGSNDVCFVLGRIFSGFSEYLADYSLCEMLRSILFKCENSYLIYNTLFVRPLKHCLAVVGNHTVGRALTTVTGGRIDSWLQKYEELVGLREVKEAQQNVIEVIRLMFLFISRFVYRGSTITSPRIEFHNGATL